MNKTELIAKLASTTGITKALSTRCVDALFDANTGAIPSAISNGEDVGIAGFGTFTGKTRKAWKGVNPATREPIQIPAKRVPGFHAGKGLRDRVAG